MKNTPMANNFGLRSLPVAELDTRYNRKRSSEYQCFIAYKLDHGIRVVNEETGESADFATKAEAASVSFVYRMPVSVRLELWEMFYPVADELGSKPGEIWSLDLAGEEVPALRGDKAWYMVIGPSNNRRLELDSDSILSGVRIWPVKEWNDGKYRI